MLPKLIAMPVLEQSTLIAFYREPRTGPRVTRYGAEHPQPDTSLDQYTKKISKAKQKVF